MTEYAVIKDTYHLDTVRARAVAALAYIDRRPNPSTIEVRGDDANPYSATEAVELCRGALAHFLEATAPSPEEPGNDYPPRQVSSMSPSELAQSVMALHFAGATEGYQDGFDEGVQQGAVDSNFVRDMIETAIKLDRGGFL